MEKYTEEELKEVLRLHKLWDASNYGGHEKGVKADLSHSKINGFDFSGADLSQANLSCSDFENCCFKHAILDNADLSDSNFRNCDFRFAKLNCTMMRCSEFPHAKFAFANIRYSDLGFSNFTSADFTSANLYRARLDGAILDNANFNGVDFDEACLPLFPKNLTVNMDDRIITQLLYYVLSIAKNSTNTSEDLKSVLLTEQLKEIANKYHHGDSINAV